MPAPLRGGGASRKRPPGCLIHTSGGGGDRGETVSLTHTIAALSNNKLAKD